MSYNKWVKFIYFLNVNKFFKFNESRKNLRKMTKFKKSEKLRKMKNFKENEIKLGKSFSVYKIFSVFRKYPPRFDIYIWLDISNVRFACVLWRCLGRAIGELILIIR